MSLFAVVLPYVSVVNSFIVPNRLMSVNWSQLLLHINTKASYPPTKHYGSKVACSFAKHSTYERRVSSGFLQLCEALRFTPSDLRSDYNQRLLHNEIRKNLPKDWEDWWSERANKLGASVASGNVLKLFQPIWVTGSTKSSVSEIFCEGDLFNDEQTFLKSSSTGLLLRQYRSDCPFLHDLWRLIHLMSRKSLRNSNY